MIVNANGKFKFQRFYLVQFHISHGVNKLSPGYVSYHCLMLLDTEPCTEVSGGVLADLKNDSSVDLVIMVTKPAVCDATIAEWQFYAANKGMFYADIWRPAAGNKFVLIATKHLDATDVGMQV